MASLLTSEQVHQVINNTVVIILARPELLDEWHSNLFEIMKRARTASYEDEAIFLAAVLSLLRHPDDTLPTGTSYDQEWEALITGLQTGTLPGNDAEKEESISVDQLLTSVVEALVAVMTQMPEQKAPISDELRQIRTAAAEGGISELTQWLDDALALLDGTPLDQLGMQNRGMYAEFWNVLVRQLKG